MISHTKKKKKKSYLVDSCKSVADLSQIFRAMKLIYSPATVWGDAESASALIQIILGTMMPWLVPLFQASPAKTVNCLRACETLTCAQFAQIEPVRSNKALFSSTVLWSNQEGNHGGARPPAPPPRGSLDASASHVMLCNVICHPAGGRGEGMWRCATYLKMSADQLRYQVWLRLRNGAWLRMWPLCFKLERPLPTDRSPSGMGKPRPGDHMQPVKLY